MTRAERNIEVAIAAFKAALTAGDAVDEVITFTSCPHGPRGADWRVTSAQIERCLQHLTSKTPAELAEETFG
jgi:hypothetical protein